MANRSMSQSLADIRRKFSNSASLEMLLILLSLLPLSSGLFNYFGGSQTIAATGWLTCNGAPATDVKVKLYDVNTCNCSS